jgi:hypothetical protein
VKTTPELEAKIVRLHYAEHWKVAAADRSILVRPRRADRLARCRYEPCFGIK